MRKTRFSPFSRPGGMMQGPASRAAAAALLAALICAAVLLPALPLGADKRACADAAPPFAGGAGVVPPTAAASVQSSHRLILAWREGLADAARAGSSTPLHSLRCLLEQACGRAALEAARAFLPDLEERLRRGPWIAPDTQVLELPQGLGEGEAARLLRELGAFRLAEPDEPVKVDLVPDDPLYPRQWHLPRIGAEEAWEVTTGSPGTVVAVVDTGIDPSHPDLVGRVLPGHDFVNDDEDPADDHGHGTRVAGIIAACGGNGAGVAGVAWRVRLLPVKVLDGQGCGYYSDVIAGIRYAADRGAAVINLSLSGGASSQALQEAVDHARSRGAVVVAAAGNDALDRLGWPAACRGVLAVGALDRDGLPAPFSNQGEGMGLAAPGVGILTTAPGGAYDAVSGTSAAAPLVSGAAALVFSTLPQARPEQVEERLTSTALDLGSPGWDPSTGWGLLQAHRAVGWVEPPPSVAESDVLYFAEGYTGPGFDTFILLENPGGEAARAALRFYGPHGPSSSLDVEVPSRSRRTLHLNRLAEGEVSCSVELPPGSSLRAQRSMYFRYGGIGGGHTSTPLTPSREWYFAEGYTGEGFDTWLLLFNPYGAEAEVVAGFHAADGEREEAFILPPLTRRSVLIDELVPGREVALTVTSSLPVLAERAMYFDCGGRTGGSASGGIPSPSREWYFAEGYTGEGFDTWLLLFNPYGVEVSAQVELLRSDGLAVREEVRLGPQSRRTLHIDDLPLLSTAEFSAKVSASSPGLVAERAMYFRYRGPGGLEVDGGHAAPGFTRPADRWLLPEGYTGDGFQCWLLVVNLEEEEVGLEVFLYGGSAGPVHAAYTIAPRSRFTLLENALLPGQGVSAEVRGPEGCRLVVESSLYFNSGGADDGSN